MPSPLVVATLQAATLNTISNVLAQFITAHNQKVSLVTCWTSGI
jgi:hypothetical protein